MTLQRGLQLGCNSRFVAIEAKANYLICLKGWVAEWLKAPVLKTGRRASVSRVRIPPHPPILIDKQGIAGFFNMPPKLPHKVDTSLLPSCYARHRGLGRIPPASESRFLWRGTPPVISICVDSGCERTLSVQSRPGGHSSVD